MNIKYPEKIKIGNSDYKVIIRDDSITSEEDNMARINYNFRRIEIPKIGELTDKYAVGESLIHEVLHGILYFMGFGPEHVEEKTKKEKENSKEHERYIESISRGLVMIFRDNPDLKRWLFDILT